MEQTVFDTLYAMKEETAQALKKPIIQKKVNRALDGAADEFESMRIDSQEKIEALTVKLVNGDTSMIKEIIKERLRLKEILLMASEATEIKAYLNSTVTPQ